MPTLSCGRDLPPRAWVLFSTSGPHESPGTKCQVSPWAELGSVSGPIQCSNNLLNSLYLPSVLPESWGCLHLPFSVTFFIPTLIHGNGTSHILSFPLGCLSENLQPLQLAPNLKVPKCIHFCNQNWPHHPLDNQHKGPPKAP